MLRDARRLLLTEPATLGRGYALARSSSVTTRIQSFIYIFVLCVILNCKREKFKYDVIAFAGDTSLLAWKISIFV